MNRAPTDVDATVDTRPPVLTGGLVYFARGALLKSIFLWEPSQKGLFSDAPQRHKEKV